MEEKIDFEIRRRFGRRAGSSLVERIDEYTQPEPNTGCWLWTGAINDKGYAQIGVGYGHRTRVHSAARINYRRFVGEIPAGLEIRHQCHQRLCVNPAHLRVGTHAENIRDMVLAGRHRPGRGEKHGNAVLTADGAAGVRDLHVMGWSNLRLGRAFRVSAKTIRYVLTEGWQHDN